MMIGIDEAKCKNCKYYDEEIVYRYDGAHILDYGKCRRNAPTCADGPTDCFPKVYDSSWCGEFVSKYHTEGPGADA